MQNKDLGQPTIKVIEARSKPLLFEPLYCGGWGVTAAILPSLTDTGFLRNALKLCQF